MLGRSFATSKAMPSTRVGPSYGGFPVCLKTGLGAFSTPSGSYPTLFHGIGTPKQMFGWPLSVSIRSEGVSGRKEMLA